MFRAQGMSAPITDGLAQFLMEVVTPSMMDGVLGIGLGVCASLTINIAAEWPTTMEVASVRS
jgi:hypothetical protein